MTGQSANGKKSKSGHSWKEINDSLTWLLPQLCTLFESLMSKMREKAVDEDDEVRAISSTLNLINTSRIWIS